MRRHLASFFALFALLGACRPEEELCSAGAVVEALAAAQPGDTVRLGACEIVGAFDVPEGVRVEGVEGSSVRVNGSPIALAPGASLRTLRLRAEGEIGIVARGAGVRALEAIELDVVRGAGIAAQGATLQLRGVRLVGPVDDPNDDCFVRVAGFRVEAPCPSPPCECTPGDVRGDDELCDGSGTWAHWTAVYGIYARDAVLMLEDVVVEGFAEAGAVLDGSETTWVGGGVTRNLGVGALVQGGTVSLVDVAIRETAEGLRGIASYALLVVDGSAVEARGLRLQDNDRYGLLALRATGVISDLVAERQGDVALWIAECDGLRVEGASRITESGFAGVVVSASRDVNIEGLTVERTSLVRRTLGDLFGAQSIGDGIHLSASHDEVSLRDVTLRENARVGLLVDLSDGAPRFDDVRVDVSGDEAFGALGGARAGGTLTVGDAPWDSGVVRSGAAAARDVLGVGERLDAIGLPAPASARERTGIVFPMF